MVLGFCGATGPAGWLLTLLVWVALIVTVVWGVTRLFPVQNAGSGPAPPRQREGDEVLPPLTESDRR
jgi:hypothetical protein